MSQAASISEFLRDGAHHGPRVAHAKNHDIIDCFTCGFRHVLPLPDPASLEREYRENYYADEKPNFIAHAGEDQQVALIRQPDGSLSAPVELRNGSWIVEIDTEVGLEHPYRDTRRLILRNGAMQ